LRLLGGFPLVAELRPRVGERGMREGEGRVELRGPQKEVASVERLQLAETAQPLHVEAKRIDAGDEAGPALLRLERRLARLEGRPQTRADLRYESEHVLDRAVLLDGGEHVRRRTVLETGDDAQLSLLSHDDVGTRHDDVRPEHLPEPAERLDAQRSAL